MEHKEGGKSPATVKKLIGYRGQWYDITHFISKHPGGEVIEQFVGKDATCEIDVIHHGNVLKNRVSAVPDAPLIRNHDPFTTEMIELNQKLERDGYYGNSTVWYVWKFMILLLMILVVQWIIMMNPESFSYAIMSGILLGLFWQQCGWMIHDSVHNAMSTNLKINKYIGLFFGNLCTGFNTHEWKVRHENHHAFTNVIDEQSDCVDSHCTSEFWAYSTKSVFHVPLQNRWLIKFQYYTFLPMIFLFGRIGQMVDIMNGEREPRCIITFLIHWVWVFAMLAQFQRCQLAILCYFIASIVQASLALQFHFNHYTKPFIDKEERMDKSHFRVMAEHNNDYECPVWMEWFHGGLNFHIAHHSFPRLPRNRLREVSKMVKSICKRHDVQYTELTIWDALKGMLDNLRKVSEAYSAQE